MKIGIEIDPVGARYKSGFGASPTDAQQIWTPASVAGLSLWYDFADSASLQTTADLGPTVITNATNKANPGTYDLGNDDWIGGGDASTSPGMGTINGVQALSMAAAAGYLMLMTANSDAELVLGTSPAFSIFAVLSTPNVSNAQYWMGSQSATSSMQGLTPRDRSYFGNQYADLGAAPGAWAANTPQIREAIRAAGSAPVTIYRNSVNKGAAASGGTTIAVRIGFIGSAGTNLGTSNWLGLIGEVIVYNAALGSTDRAAVEGYLSTKWGIALDLS